MTKNVARADLFGVPSIRNARMRELESQFEAKASEIRAAFVSECASIMAE
jgi:hypothetical protein